MPSVEEASLPPLEPSVVKALAGTIAEFIDTAAKSAPGRVSSSDCRKLVARRVPPSTVAKFDVMDNYGLVLWDEILTILDRILIYPHTTTYRKHLKDAPHEVQKAWQFHSHSLRVTELYIILDRNIAMLSFLNVILESFNLPMHDQRKEFEKSFKKTFERRLRERHRLTHAHERPSLVSRIIDLSGTKFSGDKEEVEKILSDAMLSLMSRWSDITKVVGPAAPTTLEMAEAMHEEAGQIEARRMLNLVGEALLKTINRSSP